MEHALLDSAGGLDRNAAVAATLFQRPAFRFPLDIRNDPPRLVAPPPADWRTGFAAFAKLGAKSWRDGGSLRIIPAEQPLVPAARRLLASLSGRQRRYLDEVRRHHGCLDLMVFRYVDFSDISEARWWWHDGRARMSSCCLRGRSAAHARKGGEAMRRLIASLAPSLPPRIIVDLAIEPDGRISVLELNPGPDRPGHQPET